MSIFKLDTESVTSAASSIRDISSDVSSLGDTVSGFNVQDPGFGFATVAGIISQNLEACSIKMDNTANIMEAVVDSHTQLQNTSASGAETNIPPTSANPSGSSDSPSGSSDSPSGSSGSPSGGSSGSPSGGSSGSPSGGSSGSPSGSSASPSSAIPSSALGSAAGLGSSIATANSPTAYNKDSLSANQVGALDLSYITQEEWNKLSEDLQEAILAKLKEAGYTDAEISDILNAKTGIQTVLLNAVREALEEVYKTNPAISDKLKEIYGFTPFNENGLIDDTKLKSILFIDAKDPTDQYDIVALLSGEYGVSFVDQSSFSYLKGRLESLLADNPSLRDDIKSKYGFDVFNEDGTVNDSSLTLAMLMDKASATDDFNLTTSLSKYKNSSGSSYQPSTGTSTGTKTNTNTNTNSSDATRTDYSLQDASKLLKETSSPTTVPTSSRGGSGSSSTSTGSGGASTAGAAAGAGGEADGATPGLSDARASLADITTSLISKKLPISGQGIQQMSSTVTGGSMGGSVAAGVASAGILGGALVGIEKKKEMSAAIKKIYINPSKWNSIPKEEQAIIHRTLKEAGYSEQEIDQIVRGKIGVYEVLVEAVQSVLDELMQSDATIENTIKGVYEFSPFDLNGRTDVTKLILLLLTDGKNPEDQWDIVQLLHDCYKIDLVDMNQYQDLSQFLKTACRQDPVLSEKLFKKYGIRIITDSGKIDYNNLILGMLIDSKSSSDSYDIRSFVNKEQEKLELSFMKDDKQGPDRTKSSEDDKDWLYGLGIGVKTDEEDNPK